MQELGPLDAQQLKRSILILAPAFFQADAPAPSRGASALFAEGVAPERLFDAALFSA